MRSLIKRVVSLLGATDRFAFAVCAAAFSARATAELPTVCIAGSCGNPALDLDSQVASMTRTLDTLTIHQHVENAVLNWSSFNISGDGTVTFAQPSASSVAVNRIFQNSASAIFGKLNANGRVYLVNQNGILFGDGAQVNVGGLLASSLNLTPTAISAGITAPGLVGAPALVEFSDDTGALPSGAVRVDRRASIATPEGGQVLLFAPEIANAGTISTPGGQTLLAAGKTVFLAVSSDPDLRGLLVEIGVGGEVTNGVSENATVGDPAALAGQIIAERGNVTLAGLAVNQRGRVSATTSVRANGSIRLQARDGAVQGSMSPAQGGELTLGENSQTAVTLATDGATTVDVNAQPKSTIELFGRTIDALRGSELIATAGVVTATAQADWSGDRTLTDGVPAEFSAAHDSSRVYLAPDALIDVSGENIELNIERNVIEVELRGSQLADSPEQRDGPLRSKKVRVDLRRTGTRDDGTTWQGTPLADVSGDVATIDRTVQERSLAGGTVNLVSNGDLVISQSATVDASGGSIRYRDGFVNTSQVIDAFGRPYDIAEADRDRTYVAITDAYTVSHPKWGVTETFLGFQAGQRFEAGYLEGKDAGTVRIVGSRTITDGRLIAETQIGRYQRGTPASIPAALLYRPFDQRPLGGELVIGSLDATANVAGRPRLVNALVFEGALRGPEVSAELGRPFDALADLLPESATTFRLRPDLFEDYGFTRARAFVEESVDLAAGTTVQLPPSSRLELVANGEVRIDGSLRAAGGTLNANAGSALSLGPQARLDLSGLWTNDNAALDPQAVFAPVATRGGSVSLSGGTVATSASSLIDVSGGAWRNSHGRIAYGDGGEVDFSGTAMADITGGAPPLVLQGAARGFGFRQGGSLSVSSPYICIAASDCSGLAESAFLLSPEFFAAGAFANYSFHSSFGLHVRAGTTIMPVQRNLEMSRAAALVTTGTPLSAFTREVTLPMELRRGTSLAFEHAFVPLPETPITTENFDSTGDLVVEAGSTLIGAPGSSFTFSSNTRMLIDGAVLAPGGEITARVVAPPVQSGTFIPSHGLWLGQTSRLAAPGVALVQDLDPGIRSGRLLDGGSVSLQADAGYLVLNPGATIDVSGVRDVIDVRSAFGPGTVYMPRSIASAGGHIGLSASQGIINNADLLLHSGLPGSVAGGSLAVSLLANEPLITGDRLIQIERHVAPVTAAYAANIDGSVNGTVRIDAASINRSGADFLTLTANNARFDNAQRGLGRISFVGDVDLSVRGSLTLDAAVLQSGGGSARVGASYVALGRTDTFDQATLDVSEAGNGTLEVTGNLIDFIGNLAATGFETTAFRSKGDVRLRGVQGAGTKTLNGRYATAADIVLEAQQIYPGTLSDYTIASTGSASPGAGRIEVRAVPGQAGAVLSAGGRLRLEADTLVQGGVLRAPFGTISLVADELALATGSVTATTGVGTVVPFGATQGGFDWVYPLPDATQTLVFSDEESDLPAQLVELQAADVAIENGAVVDVRGGGDLLGYEWVQGIGGTRDILSTSVRPKQYAILPASELTFASIDPAESKNFGLAPGSSITIPVGIVGLDAGTYALLPARYALLPGALLVTAVDGYTDIVPGETFKPLNGGTIVAGIRSVGGTALANSRTEGFAIRPGTAALLEARYDLSRATEFFAAASTAAAFRTPRDAGTLALLPGESLAIGGAVLSFPGVGGRGAALEITAEELRITGASAGVSPAGVVTVTADALVAFGAESLLLGARRVGTTIVPEAEGGETFSVLGELARGVTVERGVQLSAAEIVLAAREELTLETGASVTAMGGGEQNYERLTLSGDAAIARVSGGEQARVRRSGVTGVTGSAVLQAGSTLGAPGAVLLDVTASSELGGILDVEGASLWLGASTIALGDAPTSTAALTLSDAQLGAFDPSQLILSSQNAIDAYGQLRVSAAQLSLLTPGIQAVSPDTNLAIDVAGSLSIAAPPGAVALAPAPGSTAVLGVTAGSIDLGSGALALAGFGSVSLNARSDLTFTADGVLSVGGDLLLSAQRVSGKNGASYAIETPGGFAMRNSAGGENTPAAVTDIVGGARLDLSAGSLLIDTAIDLRAGALVARATQGDIVIGADGRLDLRGLSATFDGEQRAAPGGFVSLESDHGAVDLLAGSVIDVSAANTGAAGAVVLRASEGAIRATGNLWAASAQGGEGGKVHVDAQSFGEFSALNALLNAGGFTAERHIRQRAPGNIVVAANDVITAHEVTLSVDRGALSVFGTVDARGEQGGSVSLFAHDNLVLSGSIDASAQSGNARGGRVQAASATGAVLFTAASHVDVSGTGDASRNGTVDVRVHRDQALSLLDAEAGNDALLLRGTINGYRALSVEALQAYTEVDGVISGEQVVADPFNPWYQDAADFMANEAALVAALGRVDDSAFRLMPGIEVTSPSDLRLDAVWDLSGWRFNGRAGALTLAANGDLLINQSLDDFAGGLAAATQESWRYRLVAGRDAGAANPLAVLRAVDLVDVGSIRLAPGQLGTPTRVGQPVAVRTSTSRIDVAAARDFVLANQAAVLYTTGIASETGVPLTNTGGLGGRPYPTGGGDIGITTGGDVKMLGTANTQLVTDWLWRTGSNVNQSSASATGWTVNFERFEQNVAALGGGDIDIRAGGDVVNFSASIPSIGRQVGGELPTDSRVEVIGAGRLDVRAGGSIHGGSYYVGLGAARLSARDDIGRAPVGSSATSFAPVLALGDASFDLIARSGLELGGVVTPTLLTHGRSQTGVNVLNRSHFSTYSDTSRVAALSTAGAVRVGGIDSALVASFTSLRPDFVFDYIFHLFPPTLEATALTGDLHASTLFLYPSPQGTFELFAGGNVYIGGADDTPVEIALSDADPSVLLTVARPRPNLSALQPIFQVAADAVRAGNMTALPGFYSPVPTHSAQRRADGETDNEPARIIANGGDVRMRGAANNAIVFAAKPLAVSATGDIVDLSILAQNLDSGSLTRLTAGRDIGYSLGRRADGSLATSERALSVSGPGQFVLTAGRDVDLQTSRGVISRGDLYNPALADRGASISVLAGLQGRTPNHSAFIDEYLEQSTAYDDLLFAYLREVADSSTTDKMAALNEFRGLDAARQRGLLEAILFAELRAGGRVAASAGPDNADYTRAFAALTTMFPGSNPTPDSDEANAYRGDVSLFFSQIYTLDGGDVSLLAPGGEINVGLASPPSAFGVSKNAAQLGIVAQSVGNVNALAFDDFQVNESRTFAADGGDILVWSTRGDIDAGRGAKTAISAPPPTISVDANGGIQVTFPDALTGSGIQTLATSEGTEPGDVDLYAPRGVVNAGDAGIVAGNLTIGATAVLGADNIQVSGVAVGVPADTGGFAAALTGVSAVASSAANAAEDTVATSRNQENATPLADQALGFLDVFVTGFGNGCDPEREDCSQ